MVKLVKVLVVLAVMVSFSGCGGNKSVGAKFSQVQDPDLRQVMADNTDCSYGSVGCRCDIYSIEGTAIASYSNNALGELMQQKHHICLGDDSTKVIGRLANYDMEWKLDSDNDMTICSVENGSGNEIEEENEDVLFDAFVSLTLEKYAFGGLLSANRDARKVHYVGLETRGGSNHYRIDFMGDFVCKNDKMVMWVNSKTNHLDRIWLQYNRDGQMKYVGVNLSGYKHVPMGEHELKLPFVLEYVDSDQYQYMKCASTKRVEFSDMQIQ